MSLSLYDDFNKQAVSTWFRIQESEQTGIRLQEESITDINLIKLQKRHPNEIVTDSFCPHEEAKNGADWEWWLGSGDFWLGLRIQAKKLDTNTLRYPSLNHHNRYGKQIDLLISKSLKCMPPRVPLYVFYNFWNHNYIHPWSCDANPQPKEVLGCSVADANFAKQVLDNGSNHLSRLESEMYPWSCLVCPSPNHGNEDVSEDLPFRVFKFIEGISRHYKWRFNLPNERPLYPKEKFVVKEVPSYVKKILSLERNYTEDDLVQIVTKRVTVVYERKKGCNIR